MTTTEFPALLCDEMLLGLGKWLRAAGYDTALANTGSDDRDLLAMALREGRLLLTRDRHLATFSESRDTVRLLHGNSLAEWAAELLAEDPCIDWLHAPFTRCLKCNRVLLPGDGGYPVAEWVRENAAPSWHCPVCRQAFWHGGHVERMLQRLHAFATKGAESAPGKT